MNFIGIDLAWTYKNETGICILDDKKQIYLEAKKFSDEMIVELIEKYKPCVVSIDAPLVVNNESGGRQVDSLLMKTKIHGRHLKLYATSRQYMTRTFGCIRGEALREQLEVKGFKLGDDLIETYPTGIFLSLCPTLFNHRYKLSSRLPLKDVIEHASGLISEISNLGFDIDLDPKGIPTKKAFKLFEDQLDGILCALNSYYLYHQESSIWSDDNGTIALPNPRR